MNNSDFIKMFAEVLELDDTSSLSENTIFKQLENWGSLSTVNLIVMIEESYGKELTPLDIRKCSTLGDIINLLDK